MSAEQTRQEWLQSLRAGDKVIAKGRYISDRIMAVSRTTPTQIIFSGQRQEIRFNKSMGVVIGPTPANGMRKIHPATDEDVARIVGANELADSKSWIQMISLQKLSLPVLRAMRSAYDTATAAEVESNENSGVKK